MTADDTTKSRLADLMWSAASHISFPAMVAVGLCVRNRVGDSGNWLPVIAECRDAMPVVNKDFMDARDPKVSEVLTAVDGIFSGERVDRWTNGGKQWWADDLVARERTAVVGTLELYK